MSPKLDDLISWAGVKVNRQFGETRNID